MLSVIEQSALMITSYIHHEPGAFLLVFWSLFFLFQWELEVLTVKIQGLLITAKCSSCHQSRIRGEDRNRDRVLITTKMNIPKKVYWSIPAMTGTTCKGVALWPANQPVFGPRSHPYAPQVMKSKSKSKCTMKNGLNIIITLNTSSHKRFPMHYSLLGKKKLKHILTYLYCTKYNEMNAFHSDA